MVTAADRLPVFDIRIDGSALAPRWIDGFAALRVQQHLSQPALCELSFAVLDGAVGELPFALGARVKITPRDAPLALFDGRISAISQGHDATRGVTLTVRAYDDLIVLRNRQTVRAHVGLTAAELAGELVADLGLAVDAAAPGPVFPRLLQTGTDFDLLLDVVQRCGLYLAVQDGELRLLTLAGRGETVSLTLHEDLLEAHIEANTLGACRAVHTGGWNPWRGVAHGASAGSARSGRDARLQTAASQAGGGDERTLLGESFQDDAQAQAWAQADLDARRAQELVFSGVALGNPALRPGARVRVGGVAAALSGTYVIASALHTLDAERGFQSEVSSALPPPRVREQGLRMSLGQVTRIDDPDHLGRLKVALPALGDLESDWLQFLAAGAGQGKGLVAPPDIGDLVLLILERADPVQAVVLGSLYGEHGLPADSDVFGPDASFCFLSPGGQRVRLDDRTKTLRMEIAAGSSLEMSPQATTLHSATPLTIEAPGRNLVIRARHIDFERG